MTHASNGFVTVLRRALTLLTVLGSSEIVVTPLTGQGAALQMGGYEVVTPWPGPLPDNDLSHDGWTWGSGSGVWAESPDKVWVSQRGEIGLPPGATPVNADYGCPTFAD